MDSTLTLTVQRTDGNKLYELRRTYFYIPGSEDGRTEDDVLVQMYDVTARLPLCWSRTMTKSAARAAADVFGIIGYFDMV